MKRFLSVVLAVIVLFSVEVPFSAFATEDVSTTTTKQNVETTTAVSTTETTTQPTTETTTKPTTTEPSKETTTKPKKETTTKPKKETTTKPKKKPTTKPKKVKVKLSQSKLSLTVNQKKTIRKKITPNRKDVTGKFYSKDPKIASVDKNGVITAKSKGKTYIYYKASTGAYARCKVTVSITKLPLTLTKTSIKTIYDKKTKKGIEVRVRYKKNNKKFYKVTYGTSNKNIATVSPKGVVTPKKAGTVKIKVFADGKMEACTVKIVDTKNSYLSLNELANRAAITKSSCTRLVYGESVLGRELEAYVIKGKKSKSNKILFMDYACHGFEDSYYRDGKVLTNLGNKVVKYYASNPSKLGKYTLVVVPCVNPDGTIAGYNNKRACSTAFGRCTAAHVDMNRDFGAFRGKESRALRSLFWLCQ